MFKEKIATGVYERSDASSFSMVLHPEKEWFAPACVWFVAPQCVIICNAAIKPFVDQFVVGIAACSCYSMLDLLVSYDHRTLDAISRDLTSFQSPLGALRDMTLPQGSTNTITIFHGDVMFILDLEPEIPNVAKPFLDDTAVKGPPLHYETLIGGSETIPNNHEICHFIWEHHNNVHQVFHQLGHAGTTVSVRKVLLAVPEVIVLGHKCMYKGCIPNNSKVVKVCT